MAKKAQYYLIKQWQPHRGTSEQNPSCIFGSMNYFVKLPLKDIKPELCYKSRKRAEREAEKLTSLYSRAAVIEVPESALRVEPVGEMEPESNTPELVLL